MCQCVVPALSRTSLDKSPTQSVILARMDAVKLVDVEKGLVEGWAIPFGGPMPGGKDLDGEAFTKDTELFLDAYAKRPVLYFHGMDKALGVGPIGAEVKWEQKDGGIWLEAQLSLTTKYHEHVMELARRGLLGYSTGANPHSVVKSASGLIEQWMWAETSLLPIPANPFGMVTMKALGLTKPMSVTDQMQLCEKLGHFPDAGEVAVSMAEKTQKNEKPDAALVARIEALEAERRDREKAQIDEARRENKRLMEAANVTG